MRMNEGIVRIWRICGFRIYEIEKLQKIDKMFFVFLTDTNGNEFRNKTTDKIADLLRKEQRCPTGKEIRKVLCENLRRTGITTTEEDTCKDCPYY